MTQLLAEPRQAPLTAFISYDKRPGIECHSPHLAPVSKCHASVDCRDCEYQRYGTLTLMVGLDLMSGHSQHFIDHIGQHPVVYRWKYRLDDVSIA